MADPLILTLALDDDTAAWLDGLRRAHFPPRLNHIGAHVTLFHALPGDEMATVQGALAQATSGRASFPIRVGGILSLGRGTALRVEAPEAAAVRGGLARAFAPWLTPQDRQGWRPHATIQNKVATGEVHALQASLAGLAPREGRAIGLDLWHYRGGPWAEAGRFPFA